MNFFKLIISLLILNYTIGVEHEEIIKCSEIPIVEKLCENGVSDDPIPSKNFYIENCCI